MYGFSWIVWMVFSSLKFSTCFTIPPINQTSSLCYVTISPVSDFLIDEKYNFVGNGKQSFRHVPTMYPPRIVLPSSIYRPCIVSVLFPYCFRFWKRERYENDRRTIRDRYGINTGLIRDRYENGLFRLLTDEIDKKLNFFIIVSFDYILHSSHPPLPVVYAKKPGSPFALTQPLYKDNLPPSRMQVD